VIEAVEYVVRQDSIKKWAVWMVELDASFSPARFVTSTPVSKHRTMRAADAAAEKLRQRDEAHISKVLA